MASPGTIHADLLKLDAHLDTSVHFLRNGWRFDQAHTFADDLSQADIPRMRGNLDGGFFVVFVPQGPLDQAAYAAALGRARARSDAIDAVVARHAEAIGPAACADDARTLKQQGRLIAFKSIENSYPLGGDLDLLAEFHRRGVRMASPVHSRGNQFADSATDQARWGGLSPLGKGWVREMNRLGMLIDASHAADSAFDAMLDLSSAPIIASHTAARAVFDTPRNLDDARIRRLAEAGGVICFANIFISAMNQPRERGMIYRTLDEEDGLDQAGLEQLRARWRELDAEGPMWSATLDDYVAALLHVIEVAGIDHVGFGADWDGGGWARGLEDVTDLPKVTTRLLAAGLTEEDLTKLWGGNLLRVLSSVQALATAGTTA